VKSLQGERLDAVRIMPHGLDGDRQFAIFDLETGLGLTARRVPELLFAAAALDDDEGVRIVLPDGQVADGNEGLCSWLGRRVELRRMDNVAGPRYEDVVDFENEDSSAWGEFEGASGPFHDSARARVSLVTTGTLGGWDRRRFRANIVLHGEREDELVGHTVTVGDATLDVVEPIGRCVMVTRRQPGGIDRDLSVLRTIARERNSFLAVGATVSRTGLVAVGASLTVSGPILYA
jgi:uncharacterized protein YcbX